MPGRGIDMKLMFQIMSAISGLVGIIVLYKTQDTSDGLVWVILGMTYLIYSKQIETAPPKKGR